jgi:hypothetical protein
MVINVNDFIISLMTYNNKATYSKGILQRILRGVDSMFKLSMLVNWRPARFPFEFFKGTPSQE